MIGSASHLYIPAGPSIGSITCTRDSRFAQYIPKSEAHPMTLAKHHPKEKNSCPNVCLTSLDCQSLRCLGNAFKGRAL